MSTDGLSLIRSIYFEVMYDFIDTSPMIIHTNDIAPLVTHYLSSQLQPYETILDDNRIFTEAVEAYKRIDPNITITIDMVRTNKIDAICYNASATDRLIGMLDRNPQLRSTMNAELLQMQIDAKGCIFYYSDTMARSIIEIAGMYDTVLTERNVEAYVIYIMTHERRHKEQPGSMFENLDEIEASGDFSSGGINTNDRDNIARYANWRHEIDANTVAYQHLVDILS